MKNEYENSVQYRFTAYLLRALENRVKSYLDRRNDLADREYIDTGLIEERGIADFSVQYQFYKYEQYKDNFQKEKGIQMILSTLNEQRLIKALFSLKNREKEILLSRIFGEMTFTEIGELFDMKPRQAEMTYYYIIRKLRKRMEE